MENAKYDITRPEVVIGYGAQYSSIANVGGRFITDTTKVGDYRIWAKFGSEDIDDDILVAAANYNGYFVYKINYEEEAESILALTELMHKSPDEMDTGLGDNRTESIVLSKADCITLG